MKRCDIHCAHFPLVLPIKVVYPHREMTKHPLPSGKFWGYSMLMILKIPAEKPGVALSGSLPAYIWRQLFYKRVCHGHWWQIATNDIKISTKKKKPYNLYFTNSRRISEWFPIIGQVYNNKLEITRALIFTGNI